MWELTEICGNCGYTLGSHSSGNHSIPQNLCPTEEGLLDFNQGPGPGTFFKPTEQYKGLTDEHTTHSQYGKFGH